MRGGGGGDIKLVGPKEKILLQIFSDDSSYRKAIGFALLFRGEVGQMILQVVGRGVALLRPLH